MPAAIVRHFRTVAPAANGENIYRVVVTNQDPNTTFKAVDVELREVVVVQPSQITGEIFVPAGELYSEDGTYAYVDADCSEFGVWSNDEEMTIAHLSADVRAALAGALLRGHI